MPERRVTLINELGLHARAAAQVVRCATKFDSRDNAQARGSGCRGGPRSILDILYLAAGHGKHLIVTATGEGAERRRLNEIETLFINGFGEI